MFIHLLVIGFAELDALVERVRVDVLEQVFGLFGREVEASKRAVAARAPALNREGQCLCAL